MSVDVDAERERIAANLTTAELVKAITAEVGALARKQIELAKTELRADIKAEAVTLGGLGISALALLVTINMLLVTVALALAQVMPAWGAGLVVAGATLAFAAISAIVSWRHRVSSPLARTRKSLKDDVQWTKERIA
jgi:Putative Actinobacterial Holin-X, holin superfamily III